MTNDRAGKFLQFGLRHEVAIRFPFNDWRKSVKVKKSINSVDAERFISYLLNTNTPALVGRLGGTEARFIGEYLKIKKLSYFGVSPSFLAKFSRKWNRRRLEVYTNAGFFFDSWDEVEYFVDEYLGALKNTNVLGAWGVAFSWPESLNLNYEKTKIIPVGYTAPWIEVHNHELKSDMPIVEPWSRALSGKKVLVVSGFADSISHQHQKITQVFPDCGYPDFELITLKAPMTAGSRDVSGKTWKELLDEVKEKMRTLDFDVALVSAGAYSYPIANYASQLGKIGIHCGGGLQLFFGIMGNRWNNSTDVLKYVNSEWTRPSLSETPQNARNIENGCYW